MEEISGEWVPNSYGGKEKPCSPLNFSNILIQLYIPVCPGALTIAEESTSFTGMTYPWKKGDSGFDLKWNMGWMNDTLRYFSTDFIYRNYHHDDLTFGLIYAFSEDLFSYFLMMKLCMANVALLSKMPGDMWQQFANLRLLFSYMICQPGKKLLFMGCEICQWKEWNCKR